jgi:hypothetical protein
MKKITTTFFLMLYALGFSQPTSSAPTPPTRVVTDVNSIFSDSYTNISTVELFPDWGQGTLFSNIVIPASNPSDNVIKYTNLDYQGINIVPAGNPPGLDFSKMTHLHIDVWTPDVSTFNLFLIDDTGDNSTPLTPTLSGWNSYDIDLSVSFPARNLKAVRQFKFEKAGFVYHGETNSIYMDNIYFWKDADPAGTPVIGSFIVPVKYTFDVPFNLIDPTSTSPGAFSYTSSNLAVATITGNQVTIVGAGTSVITANQAPSGSYIAGSVTANLVVTAAPTVAAPTPPVRNSGDVISLFSDAYSNIAIDNWSAGSGWGGGSPITNMQIAGNSTKQIDFGNFIGVDFGAGHHIDATAMTMFHIDFWTSETNLVGKVFNPKLVQFGGGAGEVSSLLLTYLPTESGTWISADVPLSSFAGAQTRNDIAQFLISSNLGTVFVDNIYLYKPAAAAGTPVIGALTVPAKNLGDAPFNLVDPTSDSPGAFSYTSSDLSVATISGNQVTVVGVGTSIITATQAASGSYIEGSVTANLVVAPPAAPTPPTRVATDVISIYSDAYTSISGVTLNPNWGQATALSQIVLSGNNTLQLANLGYQGIDWSGNAQNITNMEYLHADVWTNAESPNIWILSCDCPNHFPIASKPGSWTSIDIPVSSFTNTNLAAVNQFKFDGGTGGTIYVDNLYFWKSPAAAGTPVIGALTVPVKYTFDAPFNLIDPTSDSPGTFSYTSSDLSVATITGNQVTIVGAGTTKITANQAPSGSYIAGSVSANLVVIAAPLVAAPTPPARNSGDVFSLYSDAYSNIAIDNWSAGLGWGGGSPITDMQIEGNNTKQIGFGNFIGVDFGAGHHIDASAMTNFHMDFWTSNADLVGKVFNSKFSQWGGGAGEVSALELNVNTGTSPAIVTGSWVSIDVPLTQFVNNLTRDDIAQFLITSNLGTVFVDNIYLYKGLPLATEKFAIVGVKMYPNPASNNLTIEANNVIEKVSLFNVLGQEVVSKTTNNQVVTLDISSLQNGVYIVKTTINGVTSASRVIKN